MKRLIYFVLFLSSSVCFSQNTNDSSLIGTWVYSEKELFGKKLKTWDTIIFSPDRVYKFIFFTQGEGPVTISRGNWKIIGKDTISWKPMNYSYENGKPIMKHKIRLIHKHKSEFFQKFQMDGDKLKLYSDKRIFTYNRVKMN